VTAEGVVTLNAASASPLPARAGPLTHAPAASDAEQTGESLPPSAATVAEAPPEPEAADMEPGIDIDTASEPTTAEARRADARGTQAQGQAQPQAGSPLPPSPTQPTGLAAPAAPGLSPPTTPPPPPASAQRTPAAPPPAQMPAQQIMPVLVTLAAGTGFGGASVTVTLDPAELGRVAISVRRETENRAVVQVVAERPETLLLLLRDQPALERALAQAGVGPEGRSLSFDLAAGGQQQGRPGPGDGEGDGQRGRAGRAAVAETADTQAPMRRRAALGALDIAV
jgi:flagellar hook-length control protein FliK